MKNTHRTGKIKGIFLFHCKSLVLNCLILLKINLFYFPFFFLLNSYFPWTCYSKCAILLGSLETIIENRQFLDRKKRTVSIWLKCRLIFTVTAVCEHTSQAPGGRACSCLQPLPAPSPTLPFSTRHLSQTIQASKESLAASDQVLKALHWDKAWVFWRRLRTHSE